MATDKKNTVTLTLSKRSATVLLTPSTIKILLDDFSDEFAKYTISAWARLLGTKELGTFTQFTPTSHKSPSLLALNIFVSLLTSTVRSTGNQLALLANVDEDEVVEKFHDTIHKNLKSYLLAYHLTNIISRARIEWVDAAFKDTDPDNAPLYVRGYNSAEHLLRIVDLGNRASKNLLDHIAWLVGTGVDVSQLDTLLCGGFDDLVTEYPEIFVECVFSPLDHSKFLEVRSRGLLKKLAVTEGDDRLDTADHHVTTHECQDGVIKIFRGYPQNTTKH